MVLPEGKMFLLSEEELNRTKSAEFLIDVIVREAHWILNRVFFASTSLFIAGFLFLIVLRGQLGWGPRALILLSSITSFFSVVASIYSKLLIIDALRKYLTENTRVEGSEKDFYSYLTVSVSNLFLSFVFAILGICVYVLV